MPPPLRPPIPYPHSPSDACWSCLLLPRGPLPLPHACSSNPQHQMYVTGGSGSVPDHAAAHHHHRAVACLSRRANQSQPRANRMPLHTRATMQDRQQAVAGTHTHTSFRGEGGRLRPPNTSSRAVLLRWPPAPAARGSAGLHSSQSRRRSAPLGARPGGLGSPRACSRWPPATHTQGAKGRGRM